MTDPNNTTTNTTTPTRPRRSSLAGETFANLFSANRRSSISRSDNSAQPSSTTQTSQSYPGPITTAAVEAQRRRMSMNALSGQRKEGIEEESAVEDEPAGENGSGNSAFLRRTSSGARALQSIRTGGGVGVGVGNGGGAGGGSAGGGQGGIASSPDNFNWSDNLRTRAERTSSIAAATAGGSVGGSGPTPGSPSQPRHKSIAVMDSPPPAPLPVAAPKGQAGKQASLPPPPPRASRESRRPDHFQERILKGDFYMD